MKGATWDPGICKWVLRYKGGGGGGQGQMGKKGGRGLYKFLGPFIAKLRVLLNIH